MQRGPPLFVPAPVVFEMRQVNTETTAAVAADAAAALANIVPTSAAAAATASTTSAAAAPSASPTAAAPLARAVPGHGGRGGLGERPLDGEAVRRGAVGLQAHLVRQFAKRRSNEQGRKWHR